MLRAPCRWPCRRSACALLSVAKLCAVGMLAPRCLAGASQCLYVVRNRKRRIAIAPVEIDPDAEARMEQQQQQQQQAAGGAVFTPAGAAVAPGAVGTGRGKGAASVVCGGPAGAPKAYDF